MQSLTGHGDRKVTDREAIQHARLMEEDTVYIHRSSGTLRIASRNGSAKPLDYEEANKLAVYIGFTPTPNSSYLA